MIKNFFLDHPKESEMTYLSHLFYTSYLGVIMFIGSATLFIHGLVPKFFQKTGSNTIKELYNNISIHEMKYTNNVMNKKEVNNDDVIMKDVNSID
jgi:hypothetical protein